MAGEDFEPVEPFSLAGLRFGIAQGFPLENLDRDRRCRHSPRRSSGCKRPACGITQEILPLLDEMREVNAYGGIVQPEACAIHRDRLKRRAADMDPNIRARIERGCAMSAADYIGCCTPATRLVRAMDRRLAALDALVMPTAGDRRTDHCRGCG